MNRSFERQKADQNDWIKQYRLNDCERAKFLDLSMELHRKYVDNLRHMWRGSARFGVCVQSDVDRNVGLPLDFSYTLVQYFHIDNYKP